MLFQIMQWFKEQEEGQTLVEYALILVLIAIVVITILTTMGEQINNIFTTISGSLTP